jgi:hypothetical protein
MANPKIGMRYNDALKTSIRHAKEGSINIVQSMANQVRLHEGEKAALFFYRETLHKANEQKQRKYY